MKQAKAPEFSVRPRQLGGFGIYDKFGKCRTTVPTRDAAHAWIVTQAKRTTGADALGNHAARVAGPGEVAP